MIIKYRLGPHGKGKYTKFNSNMLKKKTYMYARIRDQCIIKAL